MAAVSVNSVPGHPRLLKPAELVFHSRVCGQLRREAAKQTNTGFATGRPDDQVQCDRQAQQPGDAHASTGYAEVPTYSIHPGRRLGSCCVLHTPYWHPCGRSSCDALHATQTAENGPFGYALIAFSVPSVFCTRQPCHVRAWVGRPTRTQNAPARASSKIDAAHIPIPPQMATAA